MSLFPLLIGVDLYSTENYVMKGGVRTSVRAVQVRCCVSASRQTGRYKILERGLVLGKAVTK